MNIRTVIKETIAKPYFNMLKRFDHNRFNFMNDTLYKQNPDKGMTTIIKCQGYKTFFFAVDAAAKKARVLP
jgi:hypothetical protein